MASKTKLHQLLASATSWSSDLRYDVEDYLEAHCTVQEILRLCALTDQQHVVPRGGPLDKVELLTDLLPHVNPTELLTAWDQILVERTGRQQQRQAEREALDKPHTDDDLAQVLRVLSPYEIAVLYSGQHRLLHDIQEAQVQRLANGQKLPTGIRSQVEFAHLSRMRLDGGLDWLAHDDPEKAEAVATHLTNLPDERVQQVAQSIRQKLTQPARDDARS